MRKGKVTGNFSNHCITSEQMPWATYASGLKGAITGFRVLALGGSPTFEGCLVGVLFPLWLLCRHYVKGHNKTTWQFASLDRVMAAVLSQFSSARLNFPQPASHPSNVSIWYNSYFPWKPAFIVLLVMLTMFSLQNDWISGVCCEILACFIKKEREKKERWK